MTYIYLAQTILGIFLWRRFKFSWSDSVLYADIDSGEVYGELEKTFDKEYKII